MTDSQQPPDLEILRAFVAGGLTGDALDALQQRLDESSELRALVGVLARERERTEGSSRGRDPYVGAIFGERYRIRALLGKGGMGSVYEAEHILLGRVVALKILHAEYAEHPDVRRRFENEARAVVAIEHPNIVRALDVGRTPDGSPYLVFERLVGRDLEHELDARGTLPIAEAVRIVSAVASALHAAHERGIIHRDLKPANVFLEEPGSVPKVLDFGISKLGALGGTSTHTGAVMGTPAFMAPEQLRDASRVDRRADVFAAGVMLHRMLAGTLPHDASSWEGWLAARDAGAPPLKGVPDALDAVIARAMRPDPEERFPSMRALGDALAPFADQTRPASVRPLPLGRGAKRIITPRSEPVESGTAPPAPLLGRRVELARLDEALARAFEDHEPIALCVQGTPGTGKTRLLDELVMRSRPHEPIVAHAAPDVFAALVDALAIEAPKANATHPDVRLVSDRIQVAVMQRVLEVTERRPLMLVVDDAQWVTEPAWSFLDRLLARATRRPLLVALATRDDAIPMAGALALRVRGLRRGDVARLAEHVRGHALEEDELEKLIELTEGNPFFVDQVLRAPSGLPPSVEAAIAARLDALPEAERELIKRAAVFGLPFDLGDACALGLDAPESAVLALRKKELVRRASGELERFQISSPLVAQSAARLLPDEVSRWAHERSAERLADRPQPDVEAVAEHYAAARSEHAPEWLARAVVHAAARGAVARVIDLGERVRGSAAATFETSMVLADAYELRARFDAQAGALEDARALTRTDEQQARVLSELAIHHHRHGRLEEADRLFEQAAAIPAAPSARASVLGKHAVVLAYAGRMDDASARLHEAERIVLTDAPELRADAAVWRGQLAAVRGDLSDRRNAYWAAVELYRDDVRKRAGAAVNLGDTYNRLGAYAEAERSLREAIADCEALGMTHAAAYAHANLAYALLHRGDTDQVGAALDRAEALAPQDRRLRCAASLYRARADGSSMLAEATARDAEDAGFPGIAALAWSCAAKITGDLEQSRRALAILDELGTLEEDEAEVYATHARMLEAFGLDDEAREIRARARASLMAVSRRIGDPMWREHFLTDVPAHRELLRS